MRQALDLLAAGQDLPYELARGAMGRIMDGACDPAQIGAFLMGLRVKGETTEEITAFAQAMRARSVRLRPRVEGELLDVCGTGGARVKTFNISTASAFVIAGAGVPVAKHGNRSHTSPCGSADVLEALGLRLDPPLEEVRHCIEELGLGFLFAPRHHPAMAHAAGPRKALGIRTVFNMLGPLTNPAGATAHLMGVFDPALVEKYPEVLRKLGVKRALVVHGTDGVDELSTVGDTLVGELNEAGIRHYRLRPEGFGLGRAEPAQIGNVPPPEGARLIREILSGKVQDARAQIVWLNSGAGLYAAGAAPSIEAGIEQARESIKSGAARGKLEALIARLPRPGPG